MLLFGLFPKEYLTDIYVLSLISSFITTNARFLLGKDRITGFNLTYMLQGGLLFFILLYFYYIAGYTSGGAPYGVTWEEMGMLPGTDEIDE